MTVANNMEPDEAPHNIGPHLRLKLFNTQIVYQFFIYGNLRFFAFLKNQNREKYLSVQRSNKEVAVNFLRY